MHAYLGKRGKEMLGSYLHSPMNPATLTAIQSELQNFERDRQAKGEGELWQVVAEYLNDHHG